MALVQVEWRCPHGDAYDDVCWRCTADIAQTRARKLREHMEFIQRGTGAVSPQRVAAHALADDELFENCARGRHSFIDATTHRDLPGRVLMPCTICGAKPPDTSESART